MQMTKQVLIHIVDIKYLILNKIVCKLHKDISSTSSIFLDNQLAGNIFFLSTERYWFIEIVLTKNIGL